MTHITSTLNIDPLLVQCWASVADSGPALNQHLVDVFVHSIPGTILSEAKRLMRYI